MGKTPRSLKISPLSKGYATLLSAFLTALERVFLSLPLDDYLLSLSYILYDRSNALSSTDAQRGDAVLQMMAP